MNKLDFNKNNNNLLPAIIQDADTNKVLMLGYMNEEAYQATIIQKRVTFFSRTKQRLWTKGETSGNFLEVVEILSDCDNDTILIKAKPIGPVCHLGTDTCFNEKNDQHIDVIQTLETIIKDRKNNPNDNSYTTSLFKKGINKIAQKVGEEAVEMVIEAKDNNDNLFLNEAADLLFHYLILLQAKEYQLNDVLTVLKGRMK